MYDRSMSAAPEPPRTPAEDEVLSATRSLKDALAGLSRALGQGIKDVGADVVAEVAAEITTAADRVTDELSGGRPVRAAHAAPAQSAPDSSRRSPRAAKAEQTRADLLAAACRVIAAKGYEAASVADIAKEAGYTKGALYAHFASKRDLFVALITGLNQHEIDEVREASGEELKSVMAPIAHEQELALVLVTLEGYLYALRHPEDARLFEGLGEDSLLALARAAHLMRTGEAGEPAPEDYDMAFGMAGVHLLGSILAAVAPDQREEVAAMAGRVHDKILGMPEQE